jgi:hypothetical protein
MFVVGAFCVVDIVTLLLLTKMLLLFLRCYCVEGGLMFLMLLVVEPYCFGLMVNEKFQISKFLSKFGLVCDITLQIRVLTCASNDLFQITGNAFKSLFIKNFKSISLVLV